MKALSYRTFLIVFGVSALFACTTTDSLSDLRPQRPDPSLTPRQVVQIQLSAFAANNDADEGIAIGFRFASPSNRAMTGPVERFAAMLRGPSYRIMLENDRVEFGPGQTRGDRAVQRVAIYGDDGMVVYDFHLRRQQADPYQDCWMTEAVVIVDVNVDSVAPGNAI